MCDLDEVPIYVGQSTDGIRARVRRHLTSARSDVIANRQLDVWEIAHIWAWPVAAKRVIDGSSKKRITADEEDRIELIERSLYHKYDSRSRLVNGSVVSPLTAVEAAALTLPKRVKVVVMSADEIAARRVPSRRLPRQADHFRNLLDHMLNVKNEPELRRALEAHFTWLERYYDGFLAVSARIRTASGEGVIDNE